MILFFFYILKNKNLFLTGERYNSRQGDVTLPPEIQIYEFILTITNLIYMKYEIFKINETI